MKIVPAVTGACALVARTVWDRLGGFDEKFSNGGEDVDLCFGPRPKDCVTRSRCAVSSGITSARRPAASCATSRISRRLAPKWRPQLEQLALRSWCWDYLVRNWTSSQPAADHAQCTCRVCSTRCTCAATPPPIAVEGVRAAMDLELDRWAKLLG